jgi:hypothetical protein
MLRRGVVADVLGRVRLICVLHPVGPLPASVYWRRRAVVVAGAVTVLLVLWLVASAGSPPPIRPTAEGGSSASATADGNPNGETPAPSGTLVGTPPAADPGRPGGGTDGTSSGGGTAPGAPPATQAAIPPACADSALRLTVTPEQRAYPVGTMPVLTLSVQNMSRGTCSRDLAAKQQEVLLYAGKVRLWSSNDCYPGTGRDIQALAPGERNRYSVTWSGLSSRPRCAGTRTRVGPGRYSLVGRLGTLRSAPTALVLR